MNKLAVNRNERTNSMKDKYQLILLHFAGGSCYSFDFMRKYFGYNIEFLPLELPGRGKRFEEKLLRDKGQGIQDYFEQIKKLRNKQPYSIFGHSMGATLSLSVANLMEKIGDPPSCLIVSGNPGPDAQSINKEKKYRHLMNEQEFKEELRAIGGVPEEVLENDELFNFFNPILRADFELLEQGGFLESEIKLNVPIYAFMGSKEDDLESIENWNRFTYDDFNFKVFEGDHFFIYDHPTEISNIIKKITRKAMPIPSSSKE